MSDKGDYYADDFLEEPMPESLPVIKGKKYHFQLYRDYIVCWNGNDGWTVIANVLELRQCKHLLRHAQLAEDVENLMDVFISETSGISNAICPELLFGDIK